MNRLRGISIAVAMALAVTPMALGALTGSGNVTDIVQLSTTTGTLSVLSSTASGGSASGSPVTSGGSAFTVTNSGSNVDTFLRYSWGTQPYYGASAGSTSITIRGTAHHIADLLWFRQQTIAADTTSTLSVIYSPLLVKSTDVGAASFAPAGNACTAWTGTAGSGFGATAAGTFTYKYYPESGQTNDQPATSDTFHYCLDVTNSQVYLGTAASFTTATRVYSYSSNSANGALNTYQFQPLSSGQANANFYCLLSITGSGTSATPDLAQCQKLLYGTQGVATAKLYALHDPPAHFPSVNQGGTITYGVSGMQWNPYAAATTNDA